MTGKLRKINGLATMPPRRFGFLRSAVRKSFILSKYVFCFVVAISIDRLPGWAAITSATVANVAIALILIALGSRSGAQVRSSKSPDTQPM